MKKNQIIQVPLKLISSSQQDKVFEDIEAIVPSIKKKRILLPISVRINPDKTGEFIVNLGEKRYRAALALGLNTIPVIIGEASEVFEEIKISMEQIRPSYQHITVDDVKKLQVKVIGFFTDKK